MTPPLRELQRRFAAAMVAGEDARMRVYRNTVVANYRNALGATYRVVRDITGAVFFDAAVDAFVAAHPSTGGDLNIYGGEFAAFLACYRHARELPYLPDVARLEWALDECNRAADPQVAPADTVAALGTLSPDELAARALALDPACRLVHSRYPVMRIWQAHQQGGDFAIDFDAGDDHLLVRREEGVPVIERISPAEHAWLAALAEGRALGEALGKAFALQADFDAAGALGRHMASGTLLA
jgi:hypothetical protein